MATPGNIQNIQLLDYNANPITPITYLDSISDYQNESTLTGKDVFNSWLAPLADASLTGKPLTPTPSIDSSDNTISNTAFVRNAINKYAVLPTTYASTSKFGVVKIGNGISVSAGTISLQLASDTSIGGIKSVGDVSINTTDGTTTVKSISTSNNKGSLKIWSGTTSEYNLIEEKDSNTIYYVDEN